jgi:hypothetical protein
MAAPFESDRRIEVEMTGNRGEDFRRRQVAAQHALLDVAQDPLVKLRMALGRAYSNLHMPDTSRPAVVAELRQVIADPAVSGIVPGYHRQLTETVAARTSGNRCGCQISADQLALLSEALPRPEIENA